MQICAHQPVLCSDASVGTWLSRVVAVPYETGLDSSGRTSSDGESVASINAEDRKTFLTLPTVLMFLARPGDFFALQQLLCVCADVNQDAMEVFTSLVEAITPVPANLHLAFLSGKAFAALRAASYCHSLL